MCDWFDVFSTVLPQANTTVCNTVFDNYGKENSSVDGMNAGNVVLNKIRFFIHRKEMWGK